MLKNHVKNNIIPSTKVDDASCLLECQAERSFKFDFKIYRDRIQSELA